MILLFVLGISELINNNKKGKQEAEQLPTGEVREEGPAGALRSVVADVQEPEAEEVDEDGAEACGTRGDVVAKEAAEVRGEADCEDGGCNGGSAGGDEGAAAAERGRGGDTVGEVADEGLDDEARERAAEPDEAGEGVRDAQLLHVGGEQGQLQSPPELHATSHRRRTQKLAEGDLPRGGRHGRLRPPRHPCEFLWVRVEQRGEGREGGRGQVMEFNSINGFQKRKQD
jgi:hypothetical protein